MSGRRNASLRRYPALGYLAATAALALLLPSGLTVPNTGPPTLAEYAPVPGQGEGAGDTAELGLPGSDGLGAGGAGGGVAQSPPAEAEGETGGGNLIRRPGTKRCVGNPPRQTEDPLSPPCIAYFEGDNGGATDRGVSATEVTVFVASASGASTDRRAGGIVDCAEAVTPEDDLGDLMCKGYMKYFNDRYQTYGRRVHLRSHHNVGYGTLAERYQPFAHVASGGTPGTPAIHGMMSTGFAGTTRESYRKYGGLMNSFRADREDSAAFVASYLCLKLNGRPARYAGDPLLRDDTRVFGFWQSRKDRLSDFEKPFLAYLKDRCGIVPRVTALGYDDTTGAARMKAEGVTTVIMGMGQDGAATATRQATAAGFLPEWFVPGSPEGVSGLETNFGGRLPEPSQWRNAFGVGFDVRRGRREDQAWYRAYREACPDCPEPNAVAGVAPRLYDALSMLFYGIQAAGPRLTQANVDKGLHAIPPRRSPNPYQPAAYFAPGNYTFIKDAMAIWWDPSGSAPGAASAGCYRLVGGGLRFRDNEWPRGDDDVKDAGAPCQGEVPGG